jgi:hypothetical protein
MQLTEHGSLFNMLEDPKNAYGLPEEEFLIVFEHVSKYHIDGKLPFTIVYNLINFPVKLINPSNINYKKVFWLILVLQYKCFIYSIYVW